ncbi:hypothetical protein [Vibrio chagasii]|uniref:Uncharacterized protein n=1 Tax=Vibrio chagasii TaxID=170679 RepID=A0A7Y3YVU9_9VIBR|nr:hypothetical protein [Vibrio chagasii]NOH36558.1 hypothetical protein [Vibrio chagasii]
MNTDPLMDKISTTPEYNVQLIEGFKSSIYPSYEAYISDVFTMSLNENTPFALSFENSNAPPDRTKEQIQLVVIKKLNASIRHTEHLRKGGTDFGFNKSISDVFRTLCINEWI